MKNNMCLNVNPANLGVSDKKFPAPRGLGATIPTSGLETLRTLLQNWAKIEVHGEN